MTAITRFTDTPAHQLTGRQCYLALGRHTAAAVAEIRRRGLEAALEAVACMGGVSQRRGLARSLLAAIERTPDFAANAYELHDRIVFIPNIGWTWRGRRQVARLEMLPMFGPGPDRPHAALPLP